MKGRRYGRAQRRPDHVEGIPDRDALVRVLSEAGAPMDLDVIAAAFGLSGTAEVRALSRRLFAMQRDGQVMRNRKGGYALVAKMDLARGSVRGHPDGHGFLVPDDGGERIFLAARQMRTLMHGDRALVRPFPRARDARLEGVVVEVLERGRREVVGRFWRESGIAFVRPDDPRFQQDLLVPAGSRGRARSGQVVVATIVEPPTAHSPPIGRVGEVLGEHTAPGMEIDVAIRAHALPAEWSEEALTEAAQFGSTVAEGDKDGRWDLRALPLVTIDGEDARDFDDAVYCAPTEKGWRLIVAIADVAHYVRPGGALDAEARRRGTSVYFPGRVLPMLPEALSNGLCSLRPDEERLCVACEMSIDGQGRILRSRFREALMRSHARLVYEEVAAHLGTPPRGDGAGPGVPLAHLRHLHAVFEALHHARRQRGALDLDAPEVRIRMDEGGEVVAVEARRRNDAHRLIEECMIAANVAAARFLSRHRRRFLYRVHEGPTTEKAEELRAFLAPLGLRLGGGERPRPQDYARLVEGCRTRPDAELIHTVVLRSLAQAIYTPVNGGHFGLALAAYSHFTSPIRRYPDLVAHRAIKEVLSGGAPAASAPADMHALGEHASMTERRAEEATREVEFRLKCRYMQDRVGEVHSGRVSGVTGFGLFVTLEDFHVDGLVHVSALGADYFHHDPARHEMRGERSARVFRLGDRIEVVVSRVDPGERKIELEPLHPVAGPGGGRGAGRFRRRGRGRR